VKIEQWLPSVEDWKRLKDIESTLLLRRTAGTLAGVVALISAVLQVVFVIADKGYFGTLLKILQSLITLRFDELATIGLDRKTAITWGVLLVAVLVYFLLRRTSVLLRESKEAFRYTFWIEPFDQVDKTPVDRFKLDSADRFALLDHDLMERLDQRFKRFSILKEPPSRGAAAGAETPEGSRRRYSSHVQINGHYAARETGDGQWVVHVMPEVRIGPSGSPAALAQPVKYQLGTPKSGLHPASGATAPLGGAAPPAPAAGAGTAGYTLKASEYQNIVERVYSSIATEVYRRIESDVREKIALFPTAHLRAVALYHEAEDFARSNTVDAYEQAIALYQEALRCFELITIKSLTRLILHVPWVLWRAEVTYQHEWARVVAGYAKCLIYRAQTSALTGREGNPLYELPELLGESIEALKLLQKRISGQSAKTQVKRIIAYLKYPRDTWLNRIFGWSAPLFEAQKDALFELYVVDALAKYFLERGDEADEGLKNAAATAPDQITKSPLYLMALGLVEPVVDKSILYFQQAVDLAPDFQIARWYLAKAREQAFRQRDKITSELARVVLNDYGEVIFLNSGNIQALSAQGYLRWLIGDLPRDCGRSVVGRGDVGPGSSTAARQDLEQGKQVKAIAGKTFIGELSYRLARIEAESGNFEECRSLYMEAIAADPALGANLPDRDSRVASADFDDIGLSMLGRFKTYNDVVERRITRARKERNAPQHTGDRSPIAEDTLRAVQGFVLNDYANALLRYFHYHGDDSCLVRAIDAYRKATELNPADARPWFNLQNAYGWAGEVDKIEDCYKRARQLAPTWTSVTISAAKLRANELSGRLDKEEQNTRERLELIERLKSELDQARSKLKSEQESQVPVSTERGTKEAAGGSTLPQSPQGKPATAPTGPSDAATFGGAQRQSGQEKPALAPTSPAFATLRSGRQAVEKVQQLERDLEQAEKAEREKRDLVAEFQKARSEARNLIHEYSGLAAVFEEPIEEQVRRLKKIPPRKLTARIVETMIHLAELLFVRGDPSELEAAAAIAAYLLELAPEEPRVTAVLLGLIPQLLKETDKGGQRSAVPSMTQAERRKLLEKAKEQDRKTVEKWMKTYPRYFVVHYWYADLQGRTGGDAQDQNARLLTPKDIQETYFGEAHHEFDYLWGWVLFRRAQYQEAAAAFSRAIEPKPAEARYHFALGRCWEQLQNWEGARAAYCEARRLDSGAAEYREGLASALYQIGNRHRDSDRSADAADHYAQAVRLAPRTAEYHRQLAKARERAKLPDEMRALELAVPEIRTAVKLAAENAESRNDLRRMETRLAALRCYGSSRTTSMATSVTPLAVEYGKGLEPYVRENPSAETGSDLKRRYEALRGRIWSDYGVSTPRARWRLNETEMPGGAYLVMVHEVPIVIEFVEESKKLCLSPGRLRTLGLHGLRVADPLGGGEAEWLDRKDWATAEANGLVLLDPLDCVLRHLEDILVSRLHQFLGLQDVVSLLKNSDVGDVRDITKSPEQTGAITEMLRALLAERAPITPLDQLASAFLTRGKDSRPGDVIEDMRMREGVRERLWGNSADFTLVAVGPGFARRVADGLTDTGTWKVLALEVATCQDALAGVRNAIGDVRRPAVVVDDHALRIPIRKLIEIEHPRVPVLAKRELSQGLTVDASRAIEIN